MDASKWTPIEYMEYYSPDGQIFQFSEVSRFLLSFEGLGMPAIDYINQRGPLQHGETIYDYRLQKRIIQLTIRENECSRNEYWSARGNMLNILRPNRQLLGDFRLGTLVITLPDTSRRAIDVLVEQGPTFPGSQIGKWQEWSVQDTVRFIAPDPTFYDPDREDLDWETEAEQHLTLPFTFFDIDDGDLAFSLSVGSTNFSISYTGTWLSYPHITLNGPLDGPIIQNSSTGEKIDLSGYTIVDGETVVINLEFGVKTVTSTINGNIIGELSPDSDLATFHIAPEPVVPNGVNELSFGGADFSDETSMDLYYYTRYIGI